MQISDAFRIESINHFDLSDDGEFMLVYGDQHAPLALHHSVLQPLLAGTANAIGCSERIRQKVRHSRFMMHCEAWEIGTTPNGDSLVMTFHMPGRAQLSFLLEIQQIPHLMEVLASVMTVVQAPQARREGDKRLQ
jgi:hypothetical protein